ncbi:hypothetical protein [Calothrix sp. NIES-3974]|nr:hypothetical protein [Calothrix sp. NIES-3974]
MIVVIARVNLPLQSFPSGIKSQVKRYERSRKLSIPRTQDYDFLERP